jgi:hypothetical protein
MEREHLQDADVIGDQEPDGRGVGSPGVSRLGDAQPAKAGTTNQRRFMGREHLQDADVIGDQEPDGRGVCSPGFSGRYQPLGLNPLTPNCLRAV